MALCAGWVSHSRPRKVPEGLRERSPASGSDPWLQGTIPDGHMEKILRTFSEGTLYLLLAITITSRHYRGYTQSTSGASSLSISWIKAPSLRFERVCVTLDDKSMRIPAYRYQQGIQVPKIPLGGASSQSQSLLVSSCLQGLFVHFGLILEVVLEVN